METAYVKGRAAFCMGQAQSSNPFDDYYETNDFYEWDDGWKSMEAEQRE